MSPANLSRTTRFLIMLNCHHEPIQFYVPKPPIAGEMGDHHRHQRSRAGSRFALSEPGSAIELVPLSLVVCREPKPPSVTRLLSPERQ